MSKIAFIYPGQGAQVCGMGQDFYEQTETGKQVFDLATEILGFSVPELCFTKNDRLDITEYTQAAMVTTSIAMTKVLEEKGVKPDVAAGLSLGEYCALYAAGAMTEKDAIATVRQRGILMQEAVPVGQGAMAAILAMDASAIEEVISGIDGVQIANYNCPGQVVITGASQAVEEVAEKLKKAGARRVLPLQVSGPFHSPMLAEAEEKLRSALQEIKVQKPGIPYTANVTAQYVREAGEVKELLARQVSAPVRWQQCVDTLLSDGVETFVEVGPGKTLTGFVRKIDKNARVLQVQTIEDFQNLVNIWKER